MSIYVTINEAEPIFFSSVAGWSGVMEWIDELDDAQFEDLIHLAEHGYTESIPECLEQLQTAIASSPPKADVMATLTELGELLTGESGVVLINNGISYSDSSSEGDNE